MPNHVTTVCTITGPAADVAAFVEHHVRPVEGETEIRFDFNSVAPIPPIVKDTTSSNSAELGLWALTGYEKPRPEIIARMFPRSHFLDGYGVVPSNIRTREALTEWLRVHHPDWLEDGRKSAAALEATGHPDWYEWACANWGTKWNSYSFGERERGDGRYVFKFETAWAFPEPIFRKLAERYPGVVFAVASFDEGWNFACVGEFNGANDYRVVEATDDLYERVYGRKPEREEDDEEEVSR